MLLIICFTMLLSACVNPKKQEEPTFRSLNWAVGGVLPAAEDFVLTLPEGAVVRYAEDYQFTKLGEYELTVIVTDANGKERSYVVHMTLTADTTPPELNGAKDISAYIGDGIAYRSGIEMRDNCDGEITLTVDTSRVKNDVEGSYPVIYTAIDVAGNRTEVTVTLYLYRERVTEDMLYALVDPLISGKISTKGDKEMQARDVYTYVYGNINYDAHSDKSDWMRAAYDGLRTGHGDCYTYFAVCKAFFERLGIENMDIKRTEGIVTERHYWNYVNIGTEQSPRWYHLDACEIRGRRFGDGCLLTDAQVREYTKKHTDADGVTDYFYAYDAASYPASATKIITTPSR